MSCMHSNNYFSYNDKLTELLLSFLQIIISIINLEVLKYININKIPTEIITKAFLKLKSIIFFM